jgi:hypothetical protein
MRIFFLLFKRYNTKNEEGIFASESWLLFKKKNTKSEYSGPEYIFARNGLVFKARQNRGVPVPNRVPVVHEKQNFNLIVKKEKEKRQA